MADIFVHPGGSNTAPYDTWTKAATTIATAFAAVPNASGGHNVYIAPGRWGENSLVPAYPGASAAAKNKVWGDYALAKVDTDAKTADMVGSGVSAGYVLIDTSTTAGGMVLTVHAIGGASDNMMYWDFDGLWLVGGLSGLYIVSSTASQPNDGVVISNCIIEGSADVALALATFLVDIGGGKTAISVKNCIIRSGRYYSTLRYGAGVYMYTKQSTDFPATPAVIFDRCYVGGVSAGFCMESAGATEYDYIKTRNCTIQVYGENIVGYSFYGQSAAFSKIDVTDCLLVGAEALSTNVTTGTIANNYLWLNASATGGKPLLPAMPYLWPGSDAIDQDTGGSGQPYPDLFGIASVQGADDDPGAQEYVTGQYPLEPCMDVSNLTTVTPGPSTGGGLSRGRVVNAGGI